MKKYIRNASLFALALTFAACVDNSLEETPNDDNFPLQLVLDAEEGADLADAEDYGVEIKFADHLPGTSLPATTLTLEYSIEDLDGTMEGAVAVDKVVYEVELDDCTYERELDFTASADGLRGTITIAPDADLGTVPESFEVVFTLPGADDTEGGFTVVFSNLTTTEPVLLGSPRAFAYEVLDNDVAGEWELEIATEEEFEQFKQLFGPVNPGLDALSFEDITGKVTAGFEFEEMKFILELAETEEVTTCEDGASETETENKVIEIEAEYDADDGELEFEGSHPIIGDNGLVEDELDFLAEAEYTQDEAGETLSIRFFSLVDEDNFAEGEELFRDDNGVTFTFEKD
ncbi:hypothetical protein [Dawidia soli]|uniref:Uncharacterized protein n=1 Tax=Dawidia soli TaxID=2782352 RepID=A0AAP2GKP8_9BACT|nr:hypothetical protein [Dawidia soli]MBT1689258.1 hypothetical protein [Dawidia soli]